MKSLWTVSLLIVYSAILVVIWPVLSPLFGFLCLTFGIFQGILVVLLQGHSYKPPLAQSSIPSFFPSLFLYLKDHRKCEPSVQGKVYISHDLDLVIQDVLSLISRHHIQSWYCGVGQDWPFIQQLVDQEFWQMVGQLRERFSRIEMTTFVTRDVVEAVDRHLMKIRQACSKGRAFALPSHLENKQTELDFLRRVIDLALVHLLPRPYSSNSTIRHLLVEIVTVQLLLPGINLICDPDYLNQKLVTWLDQQERLHIEHKKTYAYAASYEDFVKIIDRCLDLEHLKHMRYNIISEILQATTIRNLKKARGLDTEKEYSPIGMTKGDLLQARNLGRYINQLRVAKTSCEKKIVQLGGPDYKSYTEDSQEREQENIKGKKVLSFAVVMRNAEARGHFLKFLQEEEKASLLGFWLATENLLQSPKTAQHDRATEVFNTYIMSASSIISNYLDRSIIRGMEAFLLGNSGVEAFSLAMDNVYSILEKRYYPSFIVSKHFHNFMAKQDTEQFDTADSSSDAVEERVREKLWTSQAQEKLRQLDDKIMNKSQAFNALSNLHRTHAKIEAIQVEMKAGLETLRQERRQLEAHVNRTELWLTHLGQWRTHISSSEVITLDERTQPYFVLVVYLGGPRHAATDGWVVSRSLDQFHALHKQVTAIRSQFGTMELPSRRLASQSDSLKQTQHTLDKFLVAVLADQRLSQSEPVYCFFSSSPDHLKNSPRTSVKKKFSLLKNPATKAADSSDDELVFVDDPDGSEREKDGIADLLYGLMSEIFELHGVLRLYRRTLIAFVQASFGRTINRQLHITVQWLFSPSMLAFYLGQFKESFWPGGDLAPGSPARTEDEKLLTRLKAKEKLIQNIPDMLINLMGETSSRRGVVRLFEAIQDARLNKSLFSSLLILLLHEVFPEIKQNTTAT